MLTRCPACQTVFRVSDEQLAARAGRVRCGHCLNAFDARHNAVEGDTPEEAEAGAPRPEAAPDAVPTAPATTAEALTPEPTLAGEESSQADESGLPVDDEALAGDLPAVFRTRSQPQDFNHLQEDWAGAAADESAAEGSLAEAPGAESEPAVPRREPDAVDAEAGSPAAATILTRSDPGAGEIGIHVRAASIPVPSPALTRSRTTGSPSPRVWGIAVGALSLLLLLQGLFVLRQALSQTFPALRGPLIALCRSFGCELPLPREVREISIETSDLHPEPGGQGDFVLHATLRNRAAFPQAYPYVELSLTDASDKPLVRRVFTPAEWSPGNARDAAFAPGATAIVALPFNAAGVAAVGYRVYAFYP